jgi:hypothetical protein
MRRSSSISVSAPSRPQASGASSSAGQKPMCGARCSTLLKAMKAPSMKNDPWAKLMVRVTPKISDSPTDTRNSDDALASPFSNWASRPDALMPSSSFATYLSCGCEKATRAGQHAHWSPRWLSAKDAIIARWRDGVS